MLIKLELEATPKQLTGIGQLLNGDTPALTPNYLFTPKEYFDLYWSTKVAIGAADDIGGMEYTRAFNEWIGITDPGPSSTAVDDQLAEENHQVAIAEAAVIADQESDTVTVTVTGTLDGEVIVTSDFESAASLFAESDVELGKGLNGQDIPWDARIHGSAKKKNGDGSWRLKQAVDRKVLVPQVEAELVAALTASPSPEPQEGSLAAPGADVPPPPSTKPTTFAELLPLVTAAKTSGTLTDEKIAEACVALGLSQFGLIATRPDLIPQMIELLGV